MRVSFILNGRPTTVEAPDNEVLLDTLRLRLGITSVKRGCERGECGACTVLLDGRPVYSCLVLTAQVEGREVTTAEGLAGDPLFRRVVEALVEEGAVQCGFCTPGFALTIYAALRAGLLRKASARKLLEGNLCRCTGYVKILRAAERLATG